MLMTLVQDLREVKYTMLRVKSALTFKVYLWVMTKILSVATSLLFLPQVAPDNLMGGLSATRLRVFSRMNQPQFYGSNVNEDLNGFIDEVYKVLAIMGMSSTEKVEMAFYCHDPQVHPLSQRILVS